MWHERVKKIAAQDELLVILAFAMHHNVIDQREFFEKLRESGNVGLAALQSLIPPGKW